MVTVSLTSSRFYLFIIIKYLNKKNTIFSFFEKYYIKSITVLKFYKDNIFNNNIIFLYMYTFRYHRYETNNKMCTKKRVKLMSRIFLYVCIRV